MDLRRVPKAISRLSARVRGGAARARPHERPTHRPISLATWERLIVEEAPSAHDDELAANGATIDAAAMIRALQRKGVERCSGSTPTGTTPHGTSLFTFTPGVSHGGVLIIDDHGHWDGCRAAVDQYFQEIEAPIFLSRIDYRVASE